MLSATMGRTVDIALGNVVGSKIAIILLILGVSAVVGGQAVQQRIVRVDVPLLIVVSTTVFAMALDNRIGRLDGVILVPGVVLYTLWLILQARHDRHAIPADSEDPVGGVGPNQATTARGANGAGVAE